MPEQALIILVFVALQTTPLNWYLWLWMVVIFMVWARVAMLNLYLPAIKMVLL